MKIKKLLFATLMGFVMSNNVKSQSLNDVEIHWRVKSTYNGEDNLQMMLVIKNTSNKTLNLHDWDLWFNSMFPVVDLKHQDYSFSDDKGNLFKLSFHKPVLASKDSIVAEYASLYPIPNISTVPNGFYFLNKSNLNQFFAVNKVFYKPIEGQNKNEFYADLYDKNDRFVKKSYTSPIFPVPKSLNISSGKFVLSAASTWYFDRSFTDLATNLKSQFLNFNINNFVDKNQANITVEKDDNLNDEAYQLSVKKNKINIKAKTDAGVFYAFQSLRSSIMPTNSKTVSFPLVTVDDEPRFAYRGFMLDIARNFKSKETILKYLDLMALYKLNTFHFHFIDDEGWRIEIPSIPELTKVGSVRSPLFHNGKSIKPAYGSGADNIASEFLTADDFVEILKYAKDRFIKVIPEIESPGHARAAIKAMEYRYNTLLKAGEKEEAEKYLLHDIDDKSIYNTAQNFNDNVMNPALPSVYTFLDQVLEDLSSMYKKAGIKLETVSLGGDEVPGGVWENSPKIASLMDKQKLNTVHEVWTYYIKRINEICLNKGIKLAGWEEIGMVNKGNGMVVNPDMTNKDNMLLDVWNNVIGGGQEDLAYRLANSGFPTVLISASNMYFDMMWNTNFYEPGLKWATYADLYHSYSLLPENYFANIDTYYSGKKLGKSSFVNRVRLTEKGKHFLKGIKGGLFAETVHTEEKLDYMVFPRFFALAARAWSPKKSYESEDKFSTVDFDKDYIEFINRITKYDLPKLADKVKFRLPAVGAKLNNGVWKANLEYPDFTIYYTTDGSLPNLKSSVYDTKKGIKSLPGQKISLAVIDQNGRVGQVTEIFN